MSIRKSIAWSFSEKTLQHGLQFISAVIIARLLTPDEMGIFALAMSASVVMIALRDFGVGSYLIREPDLNLAKIRSAFGVMLTISWSLGLLLLLGRSALAELYGRQGIADVLVVLAVSFFISPFGAPAAAILNRQMRFRALHNMGLAASLAGAVLSVSLAFLGFSYMSLAWGMLLSTALYAVLPLFVLPQYVWIAPSFTYWRDITRFGGLLSLGTLIGSASTESLKFIIGYTLNPGSLAQFQRALQIPSLVRRGIFGPVGRVLVPAFSEQIRQGKDIGPQVENLIAANVLFIWPSFLALSIVSEPIIVVAFGENWRLAGQIMPYLLLSQAVLSMLPQPDSILVPWGKIQRLFFLRVIAFFVSTGSAVATSLVSFELFAQSRPFVSVVFVLVSLAFTAKYLGTTLRRVFPSYLNAAFVSALCALPSLLFVSFDEDIKLLDLVCIIAASALIWLACVSATKNFVGDEIKLGFGKLAKRVGSPG